MKIKSKDQTEHETDSKSPFDQQAVPLGNKCSKTRKDLKF